MPLECSLCDIHYYCKGNKCCFFIFFCLCVWALFRSLSLPTLAVSLSSILSVMIHPSISTFSFHFCLFARMAHTSSNVPMPVSTSVSSDAQSLPITVITTIWLHLFIYHKRNIFSSLHLNAGLCFHSAICVFNTICHTVLSRNFSAVIIVLLDLTSWICTIAHYIYCN